MVVVLLPCVVSGSVLSGLHQSGSVLQAGDEAARET